MPDPEMVYQFKVMLDGSEPPVWRRFQVKADVTFEMLHFILQAVMGWEASHLYEFRFGKVRVTPLDEEEGFSPGDQALNDAETRLDALFAGKKKCVYHYDFGDDWAHTLLLEKTLKPEPNKEYPVCLDGAGACPPEDCGGIFGYRELLEILADPTHTEHEERRE